MVANNGGNGVAKIAQSPLFGTIVGMAHDSADLSHSLAGSRVRYPLQHPMIRLWVSHRLPEMRLWVDLPAPSKDFGSSTAFTQITVSGSTALHQEKKQWL